MYGFGAVDNQKSYICCSTVSLINEIPFSGFTYSISGFWMIIVAISGLAHMVN
jgi:hypothetical protein